MSKEIKVTIKVGSAIEGCFNGSPDDVWDQVEKFIKLVEPVIKKTEFDKKIFSDFYKSID